MISLYLAQNPSANRSTAIAALYGIETGTIAPTSSQRQNPVYSPLISAYDQSSGAFGDGGRIVAPSSENDVMVAGPTGSGKWMSLVALIAAVGTIATLVVGTLNVTNLTATNGVITNATTTILKAGDVTVTGTCTGCGGGGSYAGTSFVATATLMIDLGTQALTSCSEFDITATGSLPGDMVILGAEGSAWGFNRLVYNAFVSTTNAVTVRRCNIAGSTSNNPPPVIYNVEVRR